MEATNFRSFDQNGATTVLARLTSCGSNPLARSLRCYRAAGLSDRWTSVTKFFEVHIGSDQAPRLFCVEGKCHDYDPRHFVNYVVELGIVLVDCDDFFINKSLESPRRATNCGSVWPDWGRSGVGPFGQLLHSTLQLVRGDRTPRRFRGGCFSPPRSRRAHNS